MTLLEKISRGINRVVEHLLFTIGFAMAMVVILQVFCRYVLNQSLFWSEELARFLLVWLTFLGASVAYFRGAHPGIDILYRRVPPPVQKWLARLTHLISLVLFGILMVYGCQFAWFVRLQISPALQLPKWILMGIVPVSGGILAIHATTLLATGRNRRNGTHRDH